MERLIWSLVYLVLIGILIYKLNVFMRGNKKNKDINRRIK
jgi:hypothetical protein